MPAPGAVVVGVLLFLLGLRVMGVAVRHRSLPEGLVAAWLLGCGIGAPPLRIGSVPGAVGPEQARLLLIVAHGSLTLAFSCLSLFVWRTFGPASDWRCNLAVASVLCQWVALGALAGSGGFRAEVGPAMLAVVLLRACAIAWAFGETFHYARRMRRRMRLGLADPVVANRFALWSIWTGSITLVVAGAIFLRVSQACYQAGAVDLDPQAALRWMGPLLNLGGLVAVVSMALAFFPPRLYRDWIERRAQLRGPTEATS